MISSTLGSFSGITAYNKQPVDYKLLGTYYFFVTPYQFIMAYEKMDVLQKIRFNHIKPSLKIISGLLGVTLLNASTFGTGYILGNSYVKMKDSSKLE